MKVIYAPRSLLDLKAIRDFILRETNNPEVAERFEKRLLLACEVIAIIPLKYPGYPSAPKWRMKPFENYLIFFRIFENTVRIIHIRHAAKRTLRG